MNDEAEVILIRTRLKWALQALAMPAEVQLALFPDFVCKADELALDFDLHYRTALDVLGSEFTNSQHEALEAIDRKLAAMSRGGSEFLETLWEEEAVGSSPEWATVRELAVEALNRFEWPIAPPPQNPHDRGTEYVGG